MHRKHGHMHTLESISPPISRPSPPLARQGPASNDVWTDRKVLHPTILTLHLTWLRAASRNPEMVSEDGQEVLEQVYGFEKLERIDLRPDPSYFPGRRTAGGL